MSTDSKHLNNLVNIASSMFYGSIAHYQSMGLQYADVPAIVGITGACENVDTLFKVGNRSNLPLFFTQTGQLALEQILQQAHGVYTIIHSGRDEEVEDERHLRQFRLTEEEFDCTMSRMNRENYDEEKMYEALLEHIELSTKAMISSIIINNKKALLSDYKRDVKVLKEIITKPYLRINYEEAVKLLQHSGFPEVQFGDDLGTLHEAALVELVNNKTKSYGKSIDRFSPVFIMRYPKEIKFFNMKVSTKDPRVVLSADCIFPYSGESVGAAVREHDGVKLIVRLLTSMMYKLHEQRGGRYEDFQWYTEGMVVAGKTLPHAGYGVGNERIIQYVLGLGDIRKCSLFSLLNNETGDWNVSKRGMLPIYEHRKTVLLSIGKEKNKNKLLPSLKKLKGNGHILYATENTHLFLQKYGIPTTKVYKISQEGNPNLKELLKKDMFDLIINIPNGSSRDGKELTDGQLIRRTAVETGTTLITDADIAISLMDSLAKYRSELTTPEVTSKKVIIPFYDPNKSYEENYSSGPFGAFADGEDLREKDVEPKYSFLGQKLNFPFGIAAGPLINSKFVESAFKKGFDVCVYKTVRTRKYPCHPWPNVLAVEIDGDLTLEKSKQGKLTVSNIYEPKHLAITNSFGVPSTSPDYWQKDMEEAVKIAGLGQVVVGSFQGTPKGNGSVDSFIKDHVVVARLVKETGVPIIEINLSCPNEGTAHLLCFDTEGTRKIVYAVKNEIGDTPLILKLAYFEYEKDLKNFIAKIGTIVQGLVAINTIPATIVDKEGKQALPGKGRDRSGVCGAPIKWAGLDMVKRLKLLREEMNQNYAVVGVGGVLNPGDYKDYKDAGADLVMSATGAIWNPYLASQIKETTFKTGLMKKTSASFVEERDSEYKFL